MKKVAHYQMLEYERVDRLFRTFARAKTTPLRVLDFGCGRGKYLKCFASRGCDVVGTDLNPDYLQEGRNNGFVMTPPETLFGSDDARFDVVFLSHLIEHLSPDELMGLIPKLCGLLAEDGRLVIITPLLGERFFHDFSHIRPYYPQSIRHAFGQDTAELAFGGSALIELKDIYFFKDPFRTRTWRSFYKKSGFASAFTRAVNGLFDLAWHTSGGRVGAKASWMGVYERVREGVQAPQFSNGVPS